MRVTVIPIVFGVFGTVSKTWNGDRQNWKSEGKSKNHPGYSIVENGQNTEISTRDLKKLAVIWYPVRDNQQTLELKIRKQ